MSPKLHHRQQGRRSRSKSWKPSYAVPMHTSDQLRSLPELYGYTKTKRWLSVLWIFDEILVNAAYNPSMDSVKVVIDELNNRISVCYSGDVEIHQEDGVSSNYDDDSSSDTYGGATLTNIFSTEFIMETADCKRMEKSIQVFGNNMKNKSDPVITKCDVSENWTMFTFQPDFKKFNMTELENDVVALMSKRVLDIAACLGKSVKVELNGELIQVNSFSDYVDLYLSAAKSRNVERVNERWKICVSLSDDGQFQQVSFVNSLATLEGGTHVEYVTDQITTYVADYVNKKFGDTIMKPETVKSQISIFLKTVIDNATFDSQSKEALTLEQSCFGSECQLSQVFLKKVAKSCILEGLLRRVIEIDGLNTSELGVDKLEDAFNAGGVNASKCTLILTEGDSPKCLIMRGFSVLGQDYYGVYPLQGKLKNVRKSSKNQIPKSKVVKDIMKILGLEHGASYEDVNKLRYGRVMIAVDQDPDGSHVKGLVINMFHFLWSTLLQIHSFLSVFITPIVKAEHISNEIRLFYSMPEYKAWEKIRADATGWTIVYYKGLGSMDFVDAEKCFKNLVFHKKEFVWEGKQSDDAIELAFSSH